MAATRRRFLFGVAALPAGSLLAGRPLPGLVATAFNGYELHTLLQTAGEGSWILLAPGSFGDIGQFVLASSNITVRAQSPGRTVLRSPLIVQGNLVNIDDLALRRGAVLAGTGVRFSGSVISGDGIDITGVNTEVVGCEIADFSGRAITIHGSAQSPHIHDNYVHDSRRGKNFTAIQVGESMRDSSRRISALIERNRIERCRAGDSETISVKSSGNVISGNTLVDCNNVTNRHGENNAYQGNTLERSYGFVVHDAYTRLLNNRVVNPAKNRGFRIMGGNAAWDSARQGDHPQAYETFLSGNAGSMTVGAAFSGDRLPAVNTGVESHNGPIALAQQVGTVLPGGTGGRSKVASSSA